jgi:hypothetical protein
LTDSESYFNFLKTFVLGEEINWNLKVNEQYLLMCYIDIFNKDPQFDSFNELRITLSKHFNSSEIREEVISYLNYRLEQLECIEKDITLQAESALKLHGRYSRNQILAALSETTLSKQASSREGVYRIKSMNTELLFVTLYKSEGKFNASTMYHDYFINSELFHWQSQNSTSPESEVGQSYILQKQRHKDILLFVREATTDENGIVMSFVFCGKLHYMQHEGRKPMSITWRIETPPPALLLAEGRKLGVG